MGVPDFLKFVARSAPGALCRLPRYAKEQQQQQTAAKKDTFQELAWAASATLLEYDYVLVDATNAAQTIGLERLHDFLSDPRLVVHKAIVFALDAGRTREGTARHHRQAHLMIGDLDVKVQQLCSSLTELYRKRAMATAKAAREANQAPAKQAQVPYVVMSGRNVAGEADYKVLDLQRLIVCSALAAGDAILPRFLFISEDSDILCGALCGPAPQNVSIATNLRDTLFELSVLRLEHVLTYVAVCVDALVGAEQDEGKTLVPVEKTTPEESASGEAVEAIQVRPAGDSLAVAKEEGVPKPEEAKRGEDTDKEVRRKKQDGPMVAAGTRVVLADSSSSDDDDNDEKLTKQDGTPATNAATSGKGGQSVPAAADQQGDGSGKLPKPVAPPSPFDVAAGKMVHGSCVDLVFLFVVVMGNGVNVPPLVRGVTKVDIASCWQAYCKHKFTTQGTPGVGGFVTLEEREMGRVLLSAGGAGAKEEDSHQAYLSLNCRFLLSILESVHYADAQSRPPVEEEKSRAVAYLSSAVYATLRYIVACNVGGAGAELQETFLDSRPLAETEVLVPSLAAVLWVLGQDATQSFHYPLQGLARRELLHLQSGQPSWQSSTTTSSPSPSPSANQHRQHPHGAKESKGSGNNSKSGATSLVMHVGDALVCPPSASATAASWAMARGGNRGGGGGAAQSVNRTYTLQYIMSTPNTVSLTAAAHATPMRGGLGSVTATATTGGADASSGPTSVAGLVKFLCRQWQQDRLRRSTFAALCETWRTSVALAVPQLRRVAQQSLFMSPVTGNVVEGPLASTATETGASSATAATTKVTGGTKLVYSFELRRMTPLLTTTATTADVEANSAVARGGEEVRVPVSAAAGKGDDTDKMPSVQAALRAALGLSFDYAQTPTAPPASVVVDPEQLELVQPMKRHKKKERAKRAAEGAVDNAGGAAEPPTKLAKGERSEKGSGDDGGEEKKKYRRPGKKERKRLQLERQHDQQKQG